MNNSDPCPPRTLRQAATGCRWFVAACLVAGLLPVWPAGRVCAAGEERIGRPGWPVYFDLADGGPQRRFSLDLRDMTVAEALRFCLQGTDLQFVDEDTLSMSARGRLDSVTVAEALNGIAREHDLSWRVDGTQVVVSRREEAIFDVGYITEADSPFWKDIDANLRTLLTPEGALTLNPRSGIVLVRDRPSAVQRVGRLLESIERDLGRQVNIESKLVEVALDNQLEVGVDWTFFARGWKNVEGNTSKGGLVQLGSASGDGMFQMGLIRTGRLELLLDMLETHGNIRVISRPRVAAMGNEAAVFRVTESIPYYVQDVFTSEGSNPYIQYRLEFREAGVVLEVVAHASPDGNIALKVHPSVSALTGYTEPLPNLPPQPIVDQRETRTTVRMREGETLVIGGLLHEREEKNTQGVPLLCRLPLAGGLFRRTATVTKKQELVIFLTPRVLEDVLGVWQADRSRYLPLEQAVAPATPREGLALHEHARAVREFRSGDVRRAVLGARRAAGLAPDRAELRFNLAVYLAASGRLKDAEATWSELARYPETSEAARANLLALDLWKGTARPDTVAVFTPSRNTGAVLTAAQALNEASRLEGVGRTREAQKVLDEALNLLPRHAESVRLLLESARAECAGSAP